MKNLVDSKMIETALPIMTVEQNLYRAFNRANVENVHSIPNSSDPKSFEISGETDILSPLIYKVQIFVRDDGCSRKITFNAIGSSTEEYIAASLAREYGVCADFEKSMAKRDRIIDLFEEMG